MQSLRPSPNALLNPCVDPIFKILFTQESVESKEALSSFLTDILGHQVTDVVLQPNELSGESVSDKQSEFDVNCKIEGEIVNIEMQSRNNDFDYGKRAEYHVAHLLNHYTPKGLDWRDIPKVYQISVVNFHFDDNNEYYNHYILKNEKGNQLEGILNVIFLELKKTALLPDDVEKLTNAELWGKFFLYAANESKKDFVAQIRKKHRGIDMANVVLENVSQDEMNWYHESRYWMHVSDELSAKNAAERKGMESGMAKGMEQGLAKGMEQGLAQGLEQGLKQGIEQGEVKSKISIAKNLLALNTLSMEQISKVTGVTIEELKKINE